ncbi:MAG: non-canonical purine NTP pyrophosphatase, partial [Planctomycetes bacterium]|nr:non-canonical purine NTP pyrophosphatase [Planctomycetota bacterium]
MSGLEAISRLVLASRNAKKCAEMRDLLAGRGIEVVGLDAFPALPEVVEDGETFAENARKKAAEVARQVSQWTLGEDSGLEVDSLDGAPGVYSARYAGEPSNDLANNQKLVVALAGVPSEKRSARYVCRIAVADPGGEIRLECEGFCRGRIVDEPRGE